MLPKYVLTDEISVSYEILENDRLAIYIWPPVENISIDCSLSKSNLLNIIFSLKEIFDGRKVSLIYVTPKSEGTYNLIVTFSCVGPWNGTIGVYTSDSGFYQRTGIPITTLTGGTSAGSFATLPSTVFIIFHKFGMSSKDYQKIDYKINIALQVYGKSYKSFLSSFSSPIGTLMFAIATAIAIYINAFFIIDFYYKSRIEGLLKHKLALICLLIIASLFVLYQIYGVLLSGETNV